MPFVTTPIVTMPSRAFNQDAGGAKRAARQGPVIITERGKPSHVLLSIEEYRRLTGEAPGLIEMLASPETADIAFDPAPLGLGLKDAGLE